MMSQRAGLPARFGSDDPKPLSCQAMTGIPDLTRAHIEAALKLGARREQVVEVILQMLFYAGGAATANALRTAKAVFERCASAAEE